MHVQRLTPGAMPLLLVSLLLVGCASEPDEGSGSTVPGTTIAVASTATSPAVLPTDVPASAPSETYLVVAGDALSAIAAAANTSVDELVAANGWPDGAGHVIHPGDRITLPEGATSVAPRSTSTTVDPPPGAGLPPTSAAAVDRGGYRQIDPFELGRARVRDDGMTDPVTDPLVDGVYASHNYTVTDDGSAVTFQIARYISTEACIAALDTVPAGTVEPDGCYGGYHDASATAVVTMPLDGDRDVGVVVLYEEPVDRGSALRYVEITADEFGRLLSGAPPAADAPAGFEFQPADVYLEVVDGDVAFVCQVFRS